MSFCFFFFKQKTAYEMRISDWSSDVCSSDLFSTFTGWALPGQIVVIELYSLGGSLLVVAAAVAMTNARLLPMTVALMPYLRHRGTPTWRYYLFANHVAVTAWAASMRVCPRVPTDNRLPSFAAFGTMLWSMFLVIPACGFSVPQRHV